MVLMLWKSIAITNIKHHHSGHKRGHMVKLGWSCWGWVLRDLVKQVVDETLLGCQEVSILNGGDFKANI